MTPFGTRLHEATAARGRLCVGIDPHPSLLEAWGLSDDVAGLDRFCRTVVETLAPSIAIFKPQSAFFERHGSGGVAVLEWVIQAAHEAGALVLLDAKRGDIGSTMQAYADAYVNPRSPLCADAVTVSPYLGFGSLRPVIDTALEHGNGVFVLALTSNPEGAGVQHAKNEDGRTVAAAILDDVRALNDRAEPMGSIGCVVGATIDAPHEDLSINGPLLTPGLGAQGGTIDGVKAIFGAALPYVIPSVSRDVLHAGPNPDELHAAALGFANSFREAGDE